MCAKSAAQCVVLAIGNLLARLLLVVICLSSRYSHKQEDVAGADLVPAPSLLLTCSRSSQGASLNQPVKLRRGRRDPEHHIIFAAAAGGEGSRQYP